jgi:hypothetical protein
MSSKKSRKSSLLTEGRKEVIYTTTRILQEVTFPACPTLRTNAGAPQEKTQNPNYRGTRD